MIVNDTSPSLTPVSNSPLLELSELVMSRSWTLSGEFQRDTLQFVTVLPTVTETRINLPAAMRHLAGVIAPAGYPPPAGSGEVARLTVPNWPRRTPARRCWCRGRRRWAPAHRSGRGGTRP